MTMGESVELRPRAQSGMRALSAWIFALEKESGMTRSTFETQHVSMRVLS
jgi:hypothetical protein